MTVEGALALVFIASATCGAKPDPMPWAQPRLDGGEEEGDGGVALDCRPCDSWGAVEVMGPLPPVLDELSGLAASRTMPGVIYAHNDSGDTARFFALGPHGSLLAELRLNGATAVDWEDMAIGPCGDAGSCIYLADMGDNLKRRSNYTVYRVREPMLSEENRAALTGSVELDVPFDVLNFIYPRGVRHNAETLLANPITGDLYVLTKELGGEPGRVFKFPRPFQPGETVTLIEIGAASVPSNEDTLATGGDISPCGNSVLVRLYNRNVELRATPDAGLETAFRAVPIEVPSAIDEPQGEAITWGPDGQSFFTASELSGQSLHRVRCVRAQ